LKKIIAAVLLSFFLSGCISTEEEIQKRVAQTQLAMGIALTQSVESATPSLTPSPVPTLLPTSSPTPAITSTLATDAWQTMPVIPTGVSMKMCQVYKLGQMLGNNLRAFSKVGDCQSMLPDFLGYIDEGHYNLSNYSYLQSVIDFFAGSFGRNSRAVKNGLTASGVMVPLWNDWKDCGVNETPLDCEYRIHRPSFAIILVETNDANGVVPFETTLQRVIDHTIGLVLCQSWLQRRIMQRVTIPSMQPLFALHTNMIFPSGTSGWQYSRSPITGYVRPNILLIVNMGTQQISAIPKICNMLSMCAT
jgi:hypothetical protein